MLQSVKINENSQKYNQFNIQSNEKIKKIYENDDIVLQKSKNVINYNLNHSRFLNFDCCSNVQNFDTIQYFLHFKCIMLLKQNNTTIEQNK